ncbi:MAG: D-alanine--D-alanine ligase [Polyangiales bacterium]
MRSDNGWKGDAEMTENQGRRTVGVLMGGLGPEREVSLVSGAAIAEALRTNGHRVVELRVDGQIDRQLREHPIDVAFIGLHGSFGEDGCVQGLLEWMRIPYTGSSVMASALAMDKAMSKTLFGTRSIPTARWYSVDRNALSDLSKRHGDFGFPVFVKPQRGGSSVASGRADNFDELRVRCEDALRIDDDALVEECIVGKEIAVGVLDGRALGALEIEPSGTFYDYESKYTAGKSRYHYPARVSDEQYNRLL